MARSQAILNDLKLLLNLYPNVKPLYNTTVLGSPSFPSVSPSAPQCPTGPENPDARLKPGFNIGRRSRGSLGAAAGTVRAWALALGDGIFLWTRLFYPTRQPKSTFFILTLFCRAFQSVTIDRCVFRNPAGSGKPAQPENRIGIFHLRNDLLQIHLSAIIFRKI